MKKAILLVLVMSANFPLNAQWTDIRNFLSGLEIDVAYARVTQIPLIQINWRVITDYFDDTSPYKDLPFFYSQDKAWASMGTYFFNFLNADPNEMNFPALNLKVKYRQDDRLSYVQAVTNPFFSQNQRIFYLYGKTGVNKIDDADSFFSSSWGAYAHVGIIGAEDTTLIEKFFTNHFYGVPESSVLHYGLGYVLAGSGFQFISSFGPKDAWRLSTRLYFELNAFLPFVPTAELGLDWELDVNVTRDLSLFLDLKLMKSLWQSAGVMVGVRYHFRTVSELMASWEQSAADREPQVEPPRGNEPSPQEPIIDTPSNDNEYPPMENGRKRRR